MVEVPVDRVEEVFQAVEAAVHVHPVGIDPQRLGIHPFARCGVPAPGLVRPQGGHRHAEAVPPAQHDVAHIGQRGLQGIYVLAQRRPELAEVKELHLEAEMGRNATVGAGAGMGDGVDDVEGRKGAVLALPAFEQVLIDFLPPSDAGVLVQEVAEDSAAATPHMQHDDMALPPVPDPGTHWPERFHALAPGARVRPARQVRERVLRKVGACAVSHGEAPCEKGNGPDERRSPQRVPSWRWGGSVFLLSFP